MSRMPFRRGPAQQVDLLHLAGGFGEKNWKLQPNQSGSEHPRQLGYTLSVQKYPSGTFSSYKQGPVAADILEHNVYDIVSGSPLGVINALGMSTPENVAAPLSA